MPRGERPLAAGDGALLRFAGDLRRLRESAGRPTYRVMAERVHYSVAALSEAAAGRKLPTLPVTLAYVLACAGDPAEWEGRWRALAAELAASEPAGDTGDQQPPYAGLAAFQPADADRFFGRERLVDDLAGRLARQRFVAVFGASGAGKSSLLRAGMLPRWRGGGAHRPAVLFTPGPQPLEECAIALSALTGATPGPLQAELRADPRGLHRLVRQALAEQPAEAELLLVVDQFEETFTLCPDQGERQRFIAALLAAAGAPNSRCRVVLGIRADFYAHCTMFAELVEALQDSQVTIGPMAPAELRQVITQPAARAGYAVETALLTELVAQATGQVGVLPLLSHALLETWHRRRGNTLTLVGFQAAGGIEGALAQTAEAAYADLGAGRQQVAKDLLLRLTALGEGTEDTKRRISRAELADEPETAAVLDRLAAARLLALDRDAVEISHEALIRSWPRLRGWLAEDRDGLRLHRELTEATDAWEGLDRDSGGLYRGIRLARAEDWAARGGGRLTPRERDFLSASLAAQQAERRLAQRRSRRLRQLTALLAGLLVLATTATGFAVRAQRDATEQRNLALSQKVAGQAATLRDTRPALAAQLSLAAYRLEPTVEARSSVLSTFAMPYSTQLLSHTNNVNAVAFHPGGKLLATAAWDNRVRLWDVADPHRPVELFAIDDHDDNVVALAFSPHGSVLATASWDRTVRLWNVADPRRPAPLALFRAATDGFRSVAVSPDGRTVAAGNADGVVRLWALTAGRRAAVRSAPAGTVAHALGGHTDEVMTVAFSPDGRTLVAGTNDQVIRRWDVSAPGDPVPRSTLTGHTAALRAVAFSPDGRTMASSSEDRTVRLWDVSDPDRPHLALTLTGHTDRVTALAVGPDGRTLATGSDDDTVRLWDQPGPVLTSHPDGVCRATLSADGHTLVTGSRDGTARLTDLADPAHPRDLAPLAGHTAGVCGLALRPDGRLLVSGSWDHTVRRWDLGDRRGRVAPQTIARNADEIDGVVLSPDGRTLARAADDSTVRLLALPAAGPPRELGTLVGHTDDVHALAFGPTGRVLASTSWDRTVRLWDVADSRRPVLLSVVAGHSRAVLAVAISPDGRTLVTSGQDRSTRLWDIADPRAPRELSVLAGHTDTVQAVEFAPGGRTLATAGNDHTVRLWAVDDPANPREAAVLTGHTDRAYAVAFGPDGHTLVTGGADHTARWWETDAERVAARICAVAYPRITAAEWRRHLPGLPFAAPCP